MMTRAAAELADGQTVKMLIERENEFWELSLTAGE